MEASSHINKSLQPTIPIDIPLTFPSGEIFLTCQHELYPPWGTLQSSQQKSQFTMQVNKSHWRRLGTLRKKQGTNQTTLIGMISGKKRITASKFKRVAARKKDYETLVAQLKKPVRQTEAMRYGLANEGSAAATYAESKGVNVRRSGFVINPGCPHLGASPDYIVFDPNENDDPFGLMKAKCLQCLSVRIAKCLRLVNGELKLRKTHEYYYQIQGQLGLTGMQWCDLMVLCKDDWHIERIYFDEEFFNSMCSNLDKFYFDFF